MLKALGMIMILTACVDLAVVLLDNQACVAAGHASIPRTIWRLVSFRQKWFVEVDLCGLLSWCHVFH